MEKAFQRLRDPGGKLQRSPRGPAAPTRMAWHLNPPRKRLGLNKECLDKGGNLTVGCLRRAIPVLGGWVVEQPESLAGLSWV